MTARVEVVPERDSTEVTAAKKRIVKEMMAGANGGDVIGKCEDGSFARFDWGETRLSREMENENENFRR